MTYIIAVGNQKGGVAKTTTVMSLGGALTEMAQSVLLVDLDAQANLTLSTGNDPTKMRGTIADVLLQSANLYSVSRETNIAGMDLVPANAEMDLAERFLPDPPESRIDPAGSPEWARSLRLCLIGLPSIRWSSHS